jgi:hypothetical protein
VIVAASLTTGLVVALLLVAAPFIEAKENVLTGVVLPQRRDEPRESVTPSGT